jgi:eukaryotic-like serine/threonine-protein kinase
MRPFRRSRSVTEAETVVEGPPVVEEEVVEPPPPRRPPPPLIWPWLLLLLLLVLAGLGAWWFFVRDDGNGSSSSGSVVVPNVIGVPVANALARVARRGLVGRVETKSSGDVPPGAVFAEDPGAGSSVSPHSVVTLSVAGSGGGSKSVAVPSVVGLPAPRATAQLRAKGFSVRITRVASDQARATVVAQSPAAGVKESTGSTVSIRVSRGTSTVPSVVGQPLAAAVAKLKAVGLDVLILRVPSGQRRGTVVAQSPLAGTRSTGGSKARVYVSMGKSPGAEPPPPLSPSPPAPPGNAKPATITVPDVTGQAQENAQRRLNSAGLKAGVVYVPSEEPEGNVVSQSPASGTRKRGTRIQLNVSLGPSPGDQVAVPNVLGQDPAAAKSRLRASGFEVLTLPQGVSDRSQIGKIVDEQPARGRRAPSGSTVVIYVGRAA